MATVSDYVIVTQSWFQIIGAGSHNYDHNTWTEWIPALDEFCELVILS